MATANLAPPVHHQPRTRSSKSLIVRPLVLVLSDTLALALSLGIAVLIKSQVYHGVELSSYLRFWPFIFVFLGGYWMNGLYSRIGMSQPEELERGAACSCILFLTLAAATINLRGGSRFFTVALVSCVLANLILMPLFRELCRVVFAHVPALGYQTVIFGSGPEAQALIERSKADPGAGIFPVAIVDPSPQRRFHLCNLPISRTIEGAAQRLDKTRPAYGLLTVSGASSAEMTRLISSPESTIFSRIVLVSNASSMSSLWAVPVHKNHRRRASDTPRTKGIPYVVSKRMLDLTVAGLSFLGCLPVMAVIALCITVDSKGPWLFGHKRIGRNGKPFKAWKFRSMKTDGDAVLADWFTRFPEAKEEWLRQGKLKEDPRVTRVGRFLRSTSLDELPQLWNVLTGEMSLVGPRPIVDSEVHHYGENFELFSQVHGGVTGMWQVSGRSSTSYKERVMLDTFYAGNWSIWLDIAILLRTIGTVILRKGAY